MDALLDSKVDSWGNGNPTRLSYRTRSSQVAFDKYGRLLTKKYDPLREQRYIKRIIGTRVNAASIVGDIQVALTGPWFHTDLAIIRWITFEALTQEYGCGEWFANQIRRRILG